MKAILQPIKGPDSVNAIKKQATLYKQSDRITSGQKTVKVNILKQHKILSVKFPWQALLSFTNVKYYKCYGDLTSMSRSAL